MKAKRILSVILCAAMLITCSVVAGTNFASAADVSSVASTKSYNDMIASTAEDYGLADTVNDGMILQAWNWSFKNIEANLEKIASQGFTTVQVSPPNEVKEGTTGIHVLETNGLNGWWMFYQPAGFQLNESTNNALGTKSEFVSMCNKAHELGVKVIVDSVINHMGTCDNEEKVTSTNPLDHLTPMAKVFEPDIVNNKAFHTPWQNCEYHEDPSRYDQYESTRSMTRDCTSRLPDLDTSSAVVQKAIYEYLTELIQSGADGFRFDAAKHIETPDDCAPFASDFWINTLERVRKENPDVECYAYGEILNSCGVDRKYQSYTKFMDVTDSSGIWDIANAVRGWGGNPVPYYPSANFTKETCILWDESHDTYVDGSTTAYTVETRNKIWALSAGRADITGVYLARPGDATSTSGCYNILIGEAKDASWSNPVTKAINQFSNFFVGDSEYCNTDGNRAWIERGDSGCMIVNLKGTSTSVNLKNHVLKNGNYKDAITGSNFVVNGGYIKGNVGTSGIAVLYYDNGDVPTTPTSPTSPTTPGGDIPFQEGCYTVIFSNALSWGGNINYYCWDSSLTPKAPWPGEAMTYYQVNEYGQVQYFAFIPMEYDNFIINNGSSQTVDIPISDHMGVYPDSDTDSSGHHLVGTWEIVIPTPTIPPTTTVEPTSEPTTPTSESTEPPEDTYVVGDVDLDGSVSIADATYIQKKLAAMITFNEDQMRAADVDENEYVEIADVTYIQRFLARMATGTRCGERVPISSYPINK